MYVSSLSEVLEGLHRAMEESVIPCVEDEYGRTQAVYVSTQLRDLMRRWEQLPEWLALENEEARSGLAGCLEALERAAAPGHEQGARALIKALRRQLARDYPRETPRRSVASLAAEGHDLGSAMEEAVLRLEALQRSAPSNSHLGDARQCLRRAMVAGVAPGAQQRIFP